MENIYPKVGVGVIVIKDGKVLLGKRKNVHGAGSWQFPGGHLEFNESLEDCTRREVFEEVGLKIKNIHQGSFTNDVFTNEKKHYITLFALSEFDSGELVNKEPEKAESWGWYEWDNLPRPLFSPIENLIKQNFNPFI